MKKKIYLLLCLCFLAVSGSIAQDTLYYKNGTRQAVRVMEVGLDEIKFKDFQNPEAPLFTIEKSDLYRIAFADGNTLKFSDDPLSLAPAPESVKKTKAIKFEFLSPLNDCITLDFETLIKRGISLEVKLGAIGVGFDPSAENASGALLKGGVKFMKSPDYYVRGMKRTHPLRGGYIKPEILYSRYSVDHDIYVPSTFTAQTERITYNNLAVNIVFGKQSIMGDVMTFDWYIGIGYGGQWSNYNTATSTLYEDDELDFRPRAYSHTFLGPDFPLVMSAGLSIGYLFK